MQLGLGMCMLYDHLHDCNARAIFNNNLTERDKLICFGCSYKHKCLNLEWETSYCSGCSTWFAKKLITLLFIFNIFGFDFFFFFITWISLQLFSGGVAGLEYLHNGCKPPIIHRDLKPSNILLNEHMQAKIADFGLSRAFASESDSHVSTRPAGTLGYLDPE